MSTPIQQIRELRALHEEGLLSQDEFAQRKNTILDTLFSLSKPKESEAKPAASLTNKTLSGDTDLSYLAGQELSASHKHYRLIKRIGQGGMGQVWQVNDVSTELELGKAETLALKILAPEYSDSAIHRRLLIEEASLVRKLAHEHIVRVYDWGRDPSTGNYFIVMEYLQGQDVDHYLSQQISQHISEHLSEQPSQHLHHGDTKHKGITLAQALTMLTPVAHALAYAWDKYQLVHRDLKPGNLFLCDNGKVKLLDFGISARLRSHSQAGHDGPSSTLKANPHAGTAGYRAPESGTHQDVYHRTLDVYAVAVMLYQMLTGAMPFPEQRQIHHQPAQPNKLNAAQWQALQRGFAWEPAQRQSDVLSLLKEIKQHMHAAAGASIPVFHESDVRAEQRRQRKELEIQRRQQASQALQQLQAKLSQQYQENAIFKVTKTPQNREWDASKTYLARISTGTNKSS